MTTTTDFSVYRWEDGTMEFERRLPIRHELGEQVTPERVREAFEAEVQYFTPARYRVIPEDRWIDITVQARVVLA